jgi:Tetratricopeptide repeat
VATTWRLAFEDVQQTAPGAAGLLAFCAPEAIPLRLLLQPRPGLAGRLAPEVAPVLAPLLEDDLAAGDAVAALRRYSLISPPADGTVSVHRLVQAVTGDQMPAELARDWQRAAAALIEAAIPDDTNLPATWPVFAALLPHAQAALDRTSGGMWRIALYLGHSGSYRAARDLFQSIADARREDAAYGAEHPDTLRARASRAHWTGMAGDPVAARDLLAALLSVRERVSDPEHPDTLATRHALASWTGMAGDAAAARDLLAALLPVRERVLGPEHPKTLATRHDFACWTERAEPGSGRGVK